MLIVQAQIKHLDDLVPLFDDYRMFYEQNSNIKDAKVFLKERIANKESIIFIAYSNDKAVGFTQLYSLFSSVSMQPMYLLNDLFVDSNYRNKGVGNILIQAAKDLCTKNNYKGLAIQTAYNNPAQHLYERLGFDKDPDLHFFWTANK
jgi:GNAT superfamily N-acetyltransferase